MADRLCEQREQSDALGAKMTDSYALTPDEAFLDGGACRFKGIPVIAELTPEQELTVAIEHWECERR